eukprot:COSAG02_NODE_3205_length_7171_cov_18.044118_3_plen_142_part_00
MFHEGVAPALLLCVFHFPLNKLRRLFIHSRFTAEDRFYSQFCVHTASSKQLLVRVCANVDPPGGQTGKRTGRDDGRGWDRRAGAGAFVAPALLGCLGLPGENADSTQLCTRELAELAVSSRLFAWGPSVVERVLGRVHSRG